MATIWGEHGFWQKTNLHEEVIRVPLIVRVPGLKPGRTGSITELLDIYPTICELAGITVPDAVQGTSFVPVLKDPQASVKTDALSFNKGTSLRTENWHYMLYDDGSEELYDMKSDRGETVNLASTSNHAARVEEQRRRLRQRQSYFTLRNNQR